MEPHLRRLSLDESRHYCAVGIPKEGKNCIEGLVPQRIVSKVHSENTDLVMQFAAQDNKVRVKARDALKKKILEEFQSTRDFTKLEMKEFQSLLKTIATALASAV